MKKTFREKMIAYFNGVGKKHKLLKHPSVVMLSVSLFFYYIGRHFATNTKRYASIFFVGIFFVSSCSFSFAVFAERTGFTSVQETYSAVVGTSDISLAEVAPMPVETEVLLEEKESSSEYEAEGAQIEAYTLDDLLEHHEHDHDVEAYEKHVEAQTETVTAKESVFDQSDWRLVLINKQHPIPEGYDFKLGSFASGMRCDERVIEDLLLMMQAAKKDGFNLVVRSPYRTSDHQEEIGRAHV